MARTLLVRGMLAGVIAGLVALLFAYFFGEPQVAQAIAVEEAHAAAHGAGDAGAEPVSRAVQSTLGLGIAVVLLAVAIGGLFGIAFGFVNGRIGRLGPRGAALGVAVVGWTAVILVPFLKYPATPPAVGSEETVGERTAMYFLMLLISVAAAVGAVIVGRSLVARHGVWNAVLLAVLGYAAVCFGAAFLLPDLAADTHDFPADLMWRFRVASLGTQATLWVALGLVFGALTERAARPRTGIPAPVA
jgi:predicted cobalt transporter CbtA